MTRLLCAMVLSVCTAAAAQTPGLGETRPIPPERKAPPATEAQKPATQHEGEAKRCEELAGTLREDCLREQRTGEGRPANGATRRPEPPTAPPPQSPLGR